MVELEDGDILMSIRNPSKGNRIFCKSTDRGQTWGKAYFETELKDPACNGDIIRYSYSTDEGSEGKAVCCTLFQKARQPVRMSRFI